MSFLSVKVLQLCRIEKLPLKGYITEEGVSTGKVKNEQYQKFKI